MSQENKEKIIASAKESSKFFEVEISIKIFGHVIFHWVFPPQKN